MAQPKLPDPAIEKLAESSAIHGGCLMACLKAICDFHGITLVPDAVMAGLPMDNGELSPSVMPRAASRVGLNCKVVKRELVEINPALLPAILVLSEQRSCVLVSCQIESGQAEVVFPEAPETVEVVDIEDIEKDYTQFVMFLRPDRRIGKPASVSNSQKGVHWLWHTVGSAVSLYKDVLLASIFIGLLSLAMPLFVMNVYDRVVPNAATETLWVLAIGAAMVLFAEFSLRMLRHFFVELAASRIDITLTANLMQKVLGFSFKEKPASTGAFVNNLQSFEAIRGFTNSLTLVALVDLPFAVFFIVIIALINGFLSLPILVGGLLLICFGLYAQRNMARLASSASEAGSVRNGLVTESVNMFDDVKFFNAGHHVQHEWEQHSIYLAKLNAKLRIAGTSVSSAALWIQQTVGVSMIVVGVFLIVDGELTQGGLIAAYLLSSRAMGPLSQAASLLSQYHHAKTAYETLSDLMAKEDESKAEQKWTQHTRINGRLHFDKVSFAYPEQPSHVISRMSLTIEAGERVAILGNNGSGKTTLHKLLLHAYAPTSGFITLDNIDLQQYEPSTLRNQIGYVPQDINLFTGSLRDNITVFQEDYDEDFIWEILNACGLTDFVNHHPDGLNLSVGEGGKLLSGGKRQSVALARALIRRPSLFLMDEPTSAMDATAEQRIKELLDRETKGKTLILNTHRHSLLSLVDRIIVIDQGHIIVDGPRQEVIKRLAAAVKG